MIVACKWGLVEYERKQHSDLYIDTLIVKLLPGTEHLDLQL